METTIIIMVVALVSFVLWIEYWRRKTEKLDREIAELEAKLKGN